MTSEASPDWRTAEVVEAVDVAPGARRLTLRRPGITRRAEPGTHLDVRVPLGGTARIRSYSVVESSDDGSLITITVLRVRDSRGGSTHMRGLVPGDSLETTQPLQNFPLRIGAPRYVLVAGGIGITALMAAAAVLSRTGAAYRLVYVGRNRDLMAYVDRLAALHGDRLELHIDDEGSALDVPGLVAEIAGDDLARATELYMCGPIRLMDAVRRSWEDAALPRTNLRFETFGNSGWFDPEPFEVQVPQLGLSTTVRPDQTMLEALTEAGADLMYDCLKGECGLCRVEVVGLTGRIDHRDVFLSGQQREAGQHLCACVSRIVADPGDRAEVELRVP